MDRLNIIQRTVLLKKRIQMRSFSRSLVSNQTLVEQVVRYLYESIESKQILPGTKLPSIREFAAASNISKSTVVEAYDRLVALGFVSSKSKSGFYVLGRPAVLDISRQGTMTDREVDPFWMLRHSLQLPPEFLRPGCGWLPTEYLNGEGIRRALGSVRRESDTTLTEYGHPAGFRDLREQLQRNLAARDIEAGVDQIVLTDSGSQALDLAIRLLVQPGDTVLLDDPCYFNFQASLKAHRVNVVGVRLTPSGPDLVEFEQAVARSRPRLYITNSILHNPTGISFTPAHAHKVLLLARQYDFAIIEDDTFADLNEGHGTRLSSLDQLQRVIYVGSFSKTLSGAVRCGHIAAKPEWIDSILDLKLATSFGNNELSARLIHKLLIDGTYRKHVEGIRHRLRRASVTARKQIKNCGMKVWGDPEGGLFVWAEAIKDCDTSKIAQRALQNNILLAPGNVFSVTKAANRFIRFNTANSQDSRIFEFLKREFSVR